MRRHEDRRQGTQLVPRHRNDRRFHVGNLRKVLRSKFHTAVFVVECEVPTTGVFAVVGPINAEFALSIAALRTRRLMPRLVAEDEDFELLLRCNGGFEFVLTAPDD